MVGWERWEGQVYRCWAKEETALEAKFWLVMEDKMIATTIARVKDEALKKSRLIEQVQALNSLSY